MLNEAKLRKELEKLFDDDYDVLDSVVHTLNSYDGSFETDVWYNMDELDEFIGEREATDIIMLAFFGEDEDTKGQFNPNRNYFRFNGYGNLVSSDYLDYYDLVGDVIDKIINNSESYFLDDEVEEVIENCTYDYEWELKNESDMEVLKPEIEGYDVVIEDDTIYCKEDNVGNIEDIIVSMELEYC